LLVIPAKAGIQFLLFHSAVRTLLLLGANSFLPDDDVKRKNWIPAFAGMTGEKTSGGSALPCAHFNQML
jgi:hypothetical protein